MTEDDSSSFLKDREFKIRFFVKASIVLIAPKMFNQNII